MDHNFVPGQMANIYQNGYPLPPHPNLWPNHAFLHGNWNYPNHVPAGNPMFAHLHQPHHYPVHLQAPMEAPVNYFVMQGDNNALINGPANGSSVNTGSAYGNGNIGQATGQGNQVNQNVNMPRPRGPYRPRQPRPYFYHRYRYAVPDQVGFANIRGDGVNQQQFVAGGYAQQILYNVNHFGQNVPPPYPNMGQAPGHGVPVADPQQHYAPNAAPFPVPNVPFPANLVDDLAPNLPYANHGQHLHVPLPVDHQQHHNAPYADPGPNNDAPLPPNLVDAHAQNVNDPYGNYGPNPPPQFPFPVEGPLMCNNVNFDGVGQTDGACVYAQPNYQVGYVQEIPPGCYESATAQNGLPGYDIASVINGSGLNNAVHRGVDSCPPFSGPSIVEDLSEAIHPGFQCLLCGMKFQTMNHFNNHNKWHRQNTRDAGNNESADAIHPGFRCLICGMRFKAMSHFITHNKIYRQKPCGIKRGFTYTEGRGNH